MTDTNTEKPLTPGEKLREAARLTREAGRESEPLQLEDPPAELKDTELPMIEELTEETAQVLTKLALNVEVANRPK